MARRRRKWIGADLEANLGLRVFIALDLAIKLLLVGAAVWPVMVAWRRWWPDLTANWQRVLFVLAMVLLFNFAYLVGLLVLRVIVPKPREGVFRIRENRAQDPNVVIFMFNILLVKARFEPAWMLLFAPAITNLIFPFNILYRWLFGPHSKTVIVGDNFLMTDPHYTYLGKNVTIGVNCVISAHLFEGKRLLIRRIQMDDNVMVGAGAMIAPGVKIGEGAVISAAAVLLPYTQVGPGEVWEGSPAKRVAKIPMLGGDYPQIGQASQNATADRDAASNATAPKAEDPSPPA